jgi:hypothetical protein
MVADGASLALHGVALVNGQASAFGGSICVGVCGNTDPTASPKGRPLPAPLCSSTSPKGP